MVFAPVIGTLIYLLDRDSNSVLLINRDARPDDDHYGKFNGLGGKLEVDESVVAGALRELQEEAGVTTASLLLRGTITWSNFGPKREEWLGFIFLAESWEGELLSANHEGSLVWVELERLLRACSDNKETRAAAHLPMWEGDRFFVPLVFDQDERQFHGSMPYDGDKPLGWTYQRL
jgi:8-oxo-dGTP diphosphatase